MKTAKVAIATFSFTTDATRYHLETLTVCDAHGLSHNLVNTENNESMYSFKHFEDMQETAYQICKTAGYAVPLKRDRLDYPKQHYYIVREWRNILWISLNVHEHHDPKIIYSTKTYQL